MSENQSLSAATTSVKEDVNNNAQTVNTTVVQNTDGTQVAVPKEGLGTKIVNGFKCFWGGVKKYGPAVAGGVLIGGGAMYGIGTYVGSKEEQREQEAIRAQKESEAIETTATEVKAD